jgi:hypothetical protein
VRLAAPTPNPFSAETRIAFVLPKPGEIELAVFDAGGRRVHALASGRFEAGRHSVIWNGRDAAGRRAAPGLYFVTLASGDARRAQKVLRLD